MEKDFSSMPIKWPWPTHSHVADAVYDGLPEDTRKNLVKEKMEDGSNDPDEKFKDMANHHYPKSYKKAIEWLDKGKASYQQKDYENASYCFGVATHYISDTFSAPHCVSKESSEDHHNYEIVADDYTPKVTLLEGDLDTQMKKGFEQGKLDWAEWEKTKGKTIVEAGVDRGASAAYTAIKNILS